MIKAENRVVELACGCKQHVFPATRSTRFERCTEHRASRKTPDEIVKEPTKPKE